MYLYIYLLTRLLTVSVCRRPLVPSGSLGNVLQLYEDVVSILEIVIIHDSLKFTIVMKIANLLGCLGW